MSNGDGKESLGFAIVVAACVLVVSLPILGLLFAEYSKFVTAANYENATILDLQAQQGMAFWAMALFILGIVQAGISGIGIIFIWRSLSLNRDAVQAAVNANANSLKTMKAELRPWIKIIDVYSSECNLDENGLSIILKGKYKNLGRSPARNVYVSGNLHYSNSMVTPWDFLRTSAEVLPKEISVLVNTIFPDDAPELELVFKWHSPKDEVPKYVYVFVSITYAFEDFPEVHKTCRLFQLTSRLTRESPLKFQTIDFNSVGPDGPHVFIQSANTGDYAD